jgi:DNA-binding NtrC family response regulator
LQSYPWPGNVRELQNVLRQALIASAGATVLPEFLPMELHEEAGSEAEENVETQAVPDTAWHTLQQDFKAWIASGETDLYRRARERFDRLIILGTMQHVGGNRSQAGRILGLSQVTLRAKLRSMTPSTDSAAVRNEDNRANP